MNTIIKSELYTKNRPYVTIRLLKQSKWTLDIYAMSR